MAKGWIKLYRQITENPMWQSSEPFDRRSAWIDLLLMANHEPKTLQLRSGEYLEIKTGQCFTSMDHLSKRWHWSRGRVIRYLRHLTEQGMCTVNGTANGTVLTIVKYEDFQNGRTPNRTADGTTDGTTGDTTDGTRTRIYKNDKEHKKAATGRKQNSFNNFPQRGYDFDNLEAQLLQAQQRGDVNARNTETAAGSDG